MATELAKAYVQIIPSARGIEGALEKELGGSASSAGTSAGGKFGSMFKKAIAAAGLGIAAKKIFSDAFSMGGELQQNLGGTEAVFAEYASTIQNYATSAYKNMGMSASDYMATANKMGSLFQGSGIEQKRALDLTSAAMQRAADVASVMGIDTTWAMESIAGAAKGNFTMMDNLGVAMNATTLQAYALEKGLNFEWNTASQAEKAELAMQMFMERTTQYAGNFARESEETWSGSVGAMKAAYQDLMGNLMLGRDLKPSLEALGQTISTFLSGNLLPAITNILTGLPVIIKNIFPQLVSSLWNVGTQLVVSLGQGIIQGAPQLLMSAYSLVKQIWNGIIFNAPTLFAAASSIIEQIGMGLQEQLPNMLQEGGMLLVNLVNGIVANIPYLITEAGGLVVQFAGAILAALPQILQTGANLLLSLTNGITQNLPRIASSAASVIAKIATTIAQNLPQILQSGIEIIGKLAAGLIRAIPNMAAQIPAVIKAIKDVFSQTDWGSVGKNIISGIAKGLSNAGHQLWDAVKGVLGSFKDKVLDFFGIHSPARWGIWVGEMIIKGLGIGVDNGESFLSKTMYSIREAMEAPFDNGVISKTGHKTQSIAGLDTTILDRLDRIIRLLEIMVDREEIINISVAGRDAIRILRELGVVFG